MIRLKRDFHTEWSVSGIFQMNEKLEIGQCWTVFDLILFLLQRLLSFSTAETEIPIAQLWNQSWEVEWHRFAPSQRSHILGKVLANRKNIMIYTWPDRPVALVNITLLSHFSSDE
jgi:hypothetical protein